MTTTSIKKDISKKPPVLAINAENVPAFLRECSRWLGWRWELNDARDKWTKPPVDIRRDKADSSTNRRTWCDFDMAIKAAKSGFVDGIGFALGDGFCGVDFDNCRNRDSGAISADVLAYVPRLNTYGEVSPSGEGIKLILRGTLPKGRRSTDKVEMYDSGRYFCVTGQRLEGCSAELAQDEGQLAAIHGELIEAPQKEKQHKRESKLDDRELALAALEGLSPARANNYNDWLLVGMALHSAGGGCDAWDSWSRKSDKYSEGCCADKWGSFNGSAVGLGSLIHWAGEDTGWKPPRPVKRSGSKSSSSATGDDERPVVRLSTDEHISIREAIEALASDADVFQRGGFLVDVADDALEHRRKIKAPELPRILEIPEARLRTRLSACAQFIASRETENGWVDVAQHPPGWMVKGVGAAGAWPGIRHLEAVVTAPVLRHDGTILQTGGYDAETGILYIPRREFPVVHDVPLADEIGAAVDALLEVVADFPFEKDEHRAAWIAATLTPIARFAFDGPAPLFLFDANVRGAGKGLAADASSLIATGDILATASYSHDDAEMRKVITSVALAGDRAVLLDNIGGAFGVPALDAALTSTKWKDRKLGGNERVELPLLVVWYGTGNNVVLAGDIPRRICHIRLNSPEEVPEEREGFRYADLRTWIRAEHPRLLTAALTILRGYIVAGRPDMKLKPWGSFEGWSNLVRNAVVWAKLPDPGATRQELSRMADTEGGQLRALLAGWQEVDWNNRGMTVAEMFDAMQAAPYPIMHAAVLDSCTGRKGEKPTARALAYKLRHFRKRVINGRCFDTKGEDHGSQVWCVVAAAGGDGGDGGDV